MRLEYKLDHNELAQVIANRAVDKLGLDRSSPIALELEWENIGPKISVTVVVDTQPGGEG